MHFCVLDCYGYFFFLCLYNISSTALCLKRSPQNKCIEVFSFGLFFMVVFFSTALAILFILLLLVGFVYIIYCFGSSCCYNAM